MSPKARRISLLSIRILLGVIFLASGIGKLIDSSDARYLVELMATRFYFLIEYADAIVLTVSIIELILAGLLLWGKKLKLALSGSLVLVAFFTVVMGYFWIQGQSIASCGCFGALGIGGGLESTLIRNLILLILIISGFILSRSQLGNKEEQNEISLSAAE